MQWRNYRLADEFIPSNRCNFGLLEVGIPALVGGAEALFGGAEAAFAGAGEGLAGLFGGAEAGAAGAGALGGEAALGLGGDLGSLFGGAEGALGAGGAGAESFGGLGAGASDVIAAGGTPGLGAASFAPAPGVSLGAGIVPDATSAAAFGGDAAAGFGAAPGAAGILPDSTSAGGFGGGIDTSAINPPGTESSFGARFDGAPPGEGGGGVSAPSTAGGTVQPGFGSGGLGDLGPVPGGGSTAGATPLSLDQTAINSSVGQTGGAQQPLNIAPQGATTPSGAAPAAAKTGGSFLDSVSSAVSKNPVGTALAAGGLGYNILAGQQRTGAEKQIADAATAQQAEGAKLASYLNNGTLPPGLQSGVDQATAQAKANAVSNAAGQGLPTDPTKNTALAATLAKIDQQGPIIAAQIAQSLLASGASFTGMSNQLYQALANIDQSNKASMGKAIANFASALGSQKGGTTIQIGGTSNA